MNADHARTVLGVVSGASSGIGAATARLLAQNGYRVVLVARRRERLEQLAEEIGENAYPEPLDAADGEAVDEMAQRVKDQFGVPDLIVNAAGAGRWRFIEETTPQEAVAQIGAPYLAAFNLTHSFMQSMLDDAKGVIIHVNTPATWVPFPSSTGYSATRFALRGLHEALRQDLRGTGVVSSHIVLGEVTSAYFEANPDSYQYRPRIGAIVRKMSPEQAAKVIVETANNPRAQVIKPLELKLLYFLFWLLPGLVRWMVASTGRSH